MRTMMMQESRKGTKFRDMFYVTFLLSCVAPRLTFVSWRLFMHMMYMQAWIIYESNYSGNMNESAFRRWNHISWLVTATQPETLSTMFQECENFKLILVEIPDCTYVFVDMDKFHSSSYVACIANCHNNLHTFFIEIHSFVQLRENWNTIGEDKVFSQKCTFILVSRIRYQRMSRKRMINFRYGIGIDKVFPFVYIRAAREFASFLWSMYEHTILQFIRHYQKLISYWIFEKKDIWTVGAENESIFILREQSTEFPWKFQSLQL